MSQNFIFFTNTKWSEPPRLRHQLARLLMKNGNTIYFFQSPYYLWSKRLDLYTDEKNLYLFQSLKLIHPKLQLNFIMRKIDEFFQIRSIKKQLRNINKYSDCVVINFNYNYSFLRKIFRENKIITIINDDHISKLYFNKNNLLNMLKETCNRSDKVLTLSKPLQNTLKNFCSPEIFLPWSDVPYKYPSKISRKNTVLFWGYINYRIDWNFIIKISDVMKVNFPKFTLMFVGPVEKNANIPKEVFHKNNIKFNRSKSLSELNLENVLFFINPYKRSDEVDMCYISNKTFQLLSYGIPVGITGMPNFIDEDFVFRLSENNLVNIINKIKNKFFFVQPSIENFVKQNSSNKRLRQFKRFIN